jgi:hypothetical protein
MISQISFCTIAARTKQANNLFIILKRTLILGKIKSDEAINLSKTGKERSLLSLPA